MKRSIFFLTTLLFLLSSLGCVAQSLKAQLDSLLDLASQEENIARKIEIINQLSLLYFDYDVVKGDSTTHLAIDLAKKHSDRKGEGWSNVYRGIYLLFYGSLKESYGYFNEGYYIGLEIKDYNLQAYSLNGLANTFRDEGHIDSALMVFNQALKLINYHPNDYYESVLRLNKARSFLILQQPDSALREANVSLEKRKKINRRSSIPDALVIIGTCYLQKYQFDLAKQYFEQAHNLEPASISVNTQYLTSLGEMNFQLGNFDTAIEYWQEVLRNSNIYKYKYNIGHLLARIGAAYEEEGLLAVSVKYLTEALEIAHDGPHHFIEGEALLKLARIHYDSRNYRLAAKTVNQAQYRFTEVGNQLQIAECANLKGLIKMAENKFDSARYFLQTNLREQQRLKDKHGVSIGLYQISKLLLEERKYLQALQNLRIGLKMEIEINDLYGISHYYLILGKTFDRLKQYDSAEYYLNRAKVWANENSANRLLLLCYEELARNHQYQGHNALAIEFLQLRNTLVDSIFSDKLTQSIAAYTGLEEVEEKDLEIQSLIKSSEQAKQESEKQKFRLTVVSISFFILMVIAITYYIFNRKLRKLNKEVLEKSESLGTINSQLQSTLEKLNITQGQLIQSEKMASIGIMASGIAHELNNPLNFINGGTEALSQYLGKSTSIDQAKVGTYLTAIKEGVKRSSHIVKGLNQFSRQSEKENDCNLHQILENCLTVLNNRISTHIKIIKKFSTSTLILKGNEGQLHQAFLNILFNAIQSIKNDGTITITTTINSNQEIKISIADTGVGIPNQNLLRIGDPFFTTKPAGEGTGLGMYITFGIIKDHNGDISISSDIGKGTKVDVRFLLP